MTRAPLGLWVVAALLTTPLARAKGEPVGTQATETTAGAETTPATAATAAPLAESLRGMARADYAAARILYEDGDYAGALTKLAAAHADSNDPRLLWNMAACEKQLRHYASMIQLLHRYLAEGGAVIAGEERQAASALVDTVMTFVNQLTIVAEPAGAKVYVDDVERGTTPIEEPLLVDMGKHRVGVRKPGHVPYSTEVDLAGGKSLSLQVSLSVEVHEGTLRVVTDPDAVIRIDGKVVGTAAFTGQLPSGTHSVSITAPGKQPHQAEVLIKDHDESALHVSLRDQAMHPGLRANDGISPWWWVAGGVLAAGAGVGTYFLLRPGDEGRPPELGTWGGFQL